MPRPKVRLEDRQRALKACLPCKASKKRCDAQEPCSNCIRRRATSFCHYIEASPSKHHRKHSQPHHKDRNAASNSSADFNPGVDPPSSRSRRTREESADDVETAPDEPLAANDRNLAEGRMLLNSKGERGTKHCPASPGEVFWATERLF